LHNNRNCDPDPADYRIVGRAGTPIKVHDEAKTGSLQSDATGRSSILWPQGILILQPEENEYEQETKF
jgi:hypothetical protein